MKVTAEKRPEIPPMTITLETRAEVLSLLDMVRSASSLFHEGSAGDKLSGELYSVLDKHVIHYGGHAKEDKLITGKR